MNCCRGFRNIVAVFAAVLIVLTASGCSTRISRVVQADNDAPGGWVEVQAPGSARFSVIRAGRPLEPRVPQALQAGDIIETGPDTGAMIRFENGGEVILTPQTRVRLGSLEVFFGEVLADLRGAFEVFDQNLIAALGGTRFLFTAGRGRQTEVAVLEGWVNCHSPTASWEPVRLTAGHRLTTTYQSTRQPRVERLSRAEIERIDRWSDAMRNPARAGYCCEGGRVRESFARQCRGHFANTRREATRQCQDGWCCRNGQVSPSLRGDCRGSFHGDPAAAKRACTPPPPPPAVQGWCCLDGHLKQTDSKYCSAVKGQFYRDARTAKARCLRRIQ